MRSEGYSSRSVCKLGSVLLYEGGKGGERGGKGKRVKVQIKEGNSNFIFIQK